MHRRSFLVLISGLGLESILTPSSGRAQTVSRRFADMLTNLLMGRLRESPLSFSALLTQAALTPA